MKSKLIPQPQKLTLTNEKIDITQYKLSERLLDYVPVSKTLFDLNGELSINVTVDEKLAEEEYKLYINSNSIEIYSSTPKGAFYALCTLKQLIDINGNIIDSCEIEDKPGLELRSYSDDISRGQISTKENFKDIIKRIALIKYNVYMPYIEDVIKLDTIPEAGKYSDPVEKSEWKELVEFAKQYYIKIVPVYNCCGHWDKNSKLEYFKKLCMYNKGSETGDLDPRKPEVAEMLKSVMDELVEVFGEAGIFHLGGDEVMSLVPILGKEEGAKNYNALYKEIYNHLTKKNIKVLMYPDMYWHRWSNYGFGAEYIDEMPMDIGFVYWDYQAKTDYPDLDALRDRGREFYFSPSTISWGRFLPSYIASWYNTKTQTLVAKDAKGLSMSSWCDGANGMTLREENWFGLYAGANFAWNPESDITYKETVCSFFDLFYGIKDFDFEQFEKLTSYELAAVKETPEFLEDGKINRMYYYNLREESYKIQEELFKPFTSAVDAELQKRVKEYAHVFTEGFEYFSSLKPMKNTLAYNTFIFDIKRSGFACEKILLMKDNITQHSIEERNGDIPRLEKLIEEIKALLSENEKIWFETNRKSEFRITENKYLDLIDSINSYIRKYKRD